MKEMRSCGKIHYFDVLFYIFQIRITQIDCESRWKAPTDCLQYHTGEIGAFKSFNYGVQTLTENSYVICIRQEQGFCSIGYGVNQVTSVEPFLMDYIATEAAKVCIVVQMYTETVVQKCLLNDLEILFNKNFSYLKIIWKCFDSYNVQIENIS